MILVPAYTRIDINDIHVSFQSLQKL
jgi:hypothetical protein